jgi:tetratricopeptide (TPR) repeat protein
MLIASRDLALSQAASDEAIVETLCFLANQYLTERQSEKALESAMHALTHAKATLPNPHRLLSFAYEASGVTSARLGKFAEAISHFKQAIAIDETGKGRGNVDLLSTRMGLSNVMYDAADYLGAHHEALAAIAFSEKSLGQVGTNLAPSKFRAIYAAERAGNVAEAERLISILLTDELVADDPFRVGRANYISGIVAIAGGKYADAERVLDLARPGLSQSGSFSAHHSAVVAGLRLKLNDPSGALASVSPVIDAMRKRNAIGSSEFARSSERAGIAQMRLGQLEAARKSFAEACPWWRKTRPENHPDRVRCECYISLANGGADVTAMRKQLTDLRRLVAKDRADQIKLIVDLDAIVKLPDQALVGDKLYATFPLFD